MRNPASGNTRLKTSPVPVQRTTRPIQHRVLTSMPAGKVVPLLAIPLLREDSVAGAQFEIGFEMMETVEVLMNAVNVSVKAYLVPKLAFERFDGMDALNRSYQGVPPMEGQPVIPWFENIAAPAHGVSELLTYMGKHFKPGTMINTDIIEAYNCIWNFRATNRSPDIEKRDRLDQTLAPAFWLHQNFAHIVPDFDQAIIDGEVALNVVNSKMPVRGFGLLQNDVATPVPVAIRESDGSQQVYPNAHTLVDSRVAVNGSGQGAFGAAAKFINGGWYSDIWAELQDNGITVSLSNIDLARKTQAFAKLRRQYNGHSDEFIIDLLMNGISVPEQAWNQPMLLAQEDTIFGMSKRYASDAGNLTESVVNGATGIPLRFSCPRVPMGGVIMVIAEITPEQLFERQKDPYLHATDVSDLPEFLRDHLDPEPVSIVTNSEVDIDHDAPDATFGYAPLNHEWLRSIPQIGGKFYRPTVDASFDEDRQRIWAVETENPVLSRDFYLCTTMHTKPFVVTNQDPFEALVRGAVSIRGNTVFGGLLVEATNDYEKIADKAPMDRIEKPAE